MFGLGIGYNRESLFAWISCKSVHLFELGTTVVIHFSEVYEVEMLVLS